MRTLTGVSRVLLAAAVAVAALLVFGGAYFIGYVGQLQRELTDPRAVAQTAAADMRTIERALGPAGFLKSYRAFLTGDATARAQLQAFAAEAVRAQAALRTHMPAEKAAVEDAAAITALFAQTADRAGVVQPSGLRGVDEEAARALPNAAQLDTAYLTLRQAFERLRGGAQAARVAELGGLLDSALILVAAALAMLLVGLLLTAALMQLRVIHPLRILERSLSAAAEGFVSHRIWGTERRDEIGTLARAGEALRHGLAELPALKGLADKGQIHVTVEGPGSILFDKLAAQIAAAADALQAAVADASRAGVERREEIAATAARLAQACGDVQTASAVLRSDFAQAIESVRGASQTLLSTATDGATQVDRIAGRFAHGGEELAAAAARTNERVAAVLSELTATAQGLRAVTDDAKQSQATFFAAHDRVAADIVQTNEAMRGLGTRLTGVLTGTEQHLARVLGTLDRLEQGLEQTVAGLHGRVVETGQALARAASSFDERTTAAETRFAASMGEFAQASKALGQDSEALRQYLGQVVGDVRGARRMLEDIVSTLMSDGGVFAEMAARLKQTNERLTATHPDEALRTTIVADLKAVADTVSNAAASVKAEIARLVETAGEERLLPAHGAAPMLSAPAAADEHVPARTLADVPKAEVLERLGDLAAEMMAAEGARESDAIKSALQVLADDLRGLADGGEDRFDELSDHLAQQADDLESQAGAPITTDAMRTEILALVRDLRQTLAQAREFAPARAAERVSQAAAAMEARARKLFAELDASAAASADDDFSLDTATQDVDRLAAMIAALEARAEALSEEMVARRRSAVAGGAEPKDQVYADDLRTDATIQTVFEAIERLNNVAAALARAGDAERQRRLTGR